MYASRLDNTCAMAGAASEARCARLNRRAAEKRNRSAARPLGGSAAKHCARMAVAATAALLLSACAMRETKDDFPDQPWPEPTEQTANNGAIYQSGHDIALFEN